MKKIYLLSLLIIVTSLNTSSQTPTFAWAKQIGGGSNNNDGRSIEVDASGNVYTTGNFRGTVDFDPGPGTFTMSAIFLEDIFISKLDASGNFLWAKQIGSNNPDFGYSIALDASGNVYTTGMFSGLADFDPGPGTFTLSAVGGAPNIFISKLDASGNFVWAKHIGTFGNHEGLAISIDASGNIYTTGHFNSTVDFDPGPGTNNMTAFSGSSDVFICKLDASGNFIWSRQLGGASSDVGYAIKNDISGDIYVTGSFSLTADFDPGAGIFNLTSVGSEDIFVCKLNSSGGFIWAKQIGGTGSDHGFSIDVDGSGNVYSTGRFQVMSDFDPGAGVFNMTSFGAWDVYVSKLDFAGNFVWAKQMGGTANDYGYGLECEPNGNVYVGGWFYGTADFDPGAGVYNLTPPTSTNFDGYISKLDATGNFVWAGQLGGTSNENLNAIDIDVSGNIYLTGRFQGTADLNPFGTFNMTALGQDIFIEKMAPCASAPTQPSPITGLNTMCTSVGATTYSIAIVAGATSYTWSLPGGWSGSSATNTISATPGTTGIFSVTATNACGTSPQQTLNVTVNPLPTITVNSGSICSGQSFTMVPGGANTYTFQGGSAVVSPITSTNYTVTGTSAAGCISASSATAIVTVNTTPTITVNSGSICSGQSFTMVPGGASTYTFSSGPVVSPVINTSYSVTGTSAQGCASSNTAISNVTVNTTPTITVNSGSICSGQSFTMVLGGASTYTFSSGPVVSPLINTSYSVTGTSAQGCISSNTAISNVTVNATPTISLAGGAICPGGSFTLNPSGANTYTYSSGPVVSPSVTTSYSVSGTSTAGCVSNGSAVATVTVAGTLTVTITGSNTICSGQSVNLTAGGATSYTWSTGPTTTSISVSPTVNTTYTLTGASGSCSNTAVKTITVNPLPTVSANTTNTLICTGQSATLTASGASTYTFNPGGAGASIVVSPTVNTTYTITGTNSFGCVNTSTFTQLVDPCLGINQIAISNSEINIYPNPTSGIVYLNGDLENKEIKIFNSIGELVLSPTIQNSSFNIQHLPNGIYFIQIGNVTKKLIKQ